MSESIGPTTEHIIMPIETDLLHILDAGVDIRSPARIDSTYACNWWDQPDEPDRPYILCAETLEYCLEVHRESRSGSASPPPPTSASVKAEQTIPKSANRKAPEGLAAESQEHSQCSDCHLLRLEILRLRQALQNCGTFAQTMSITFENSWEVGMRRAAGFQTMHQMAILKELDSENIPHSVPFQSIIQPSGTHARKRGADSDYNLSLPDGGVDPHTPSSTAASLGNTKIFAYIPQEEGLPPVSSDIASAPRNIGCFDPLSRYPSPDVEPVQNPLASRDMPMSVVDDTDSESEFPMDLAEVALAWNDADSKSEHSSASTSALESIDFTALEKAWNEMDSDSGNASDQHSDAVIDLAALAKAWNDFESDSTNDSASVKGSAKTSEEMSSECPPKETSEPTSDEELKLESAIIAAAHLYDSTPTSDTGRPDSDDDAASATMEDHNANIRAKPYISSEAGINPYREIDFQSVDETYLTASQADNELADADADDEADEGSSDDDE